MPLPKYSEMKQRQFLPLLAIAAVLLLALPASAQDTPPTPSPDEVNAIAKGMYCPVCENIPLDVCGTQACAQWRQQIADLLAQGYSEEEIHEYFVQQYGDRVLAEPPRRGLNWLVYIVPPVVVIAGAAFLVLYLRRLRKPASEGVPDAQGIEKSSAPYVAQLEDELRQRYKSGRKKWQKK